MLYILIFLIGAIIGMFILALMSVDTINEAESLVRASRKSLRRAENEVRELNEENKVLYKEKKELEVKIVDLENDIEFLFNNLSEQKKKLVIDGKSKN